MKSSWRTGTSTAEGPVFANLLPDFSWVGTAAVATTILGLGQNLLVARWLGPGGYGLLALVTAYPSLIHLFVDIRAWESLTRYLTEFSTRGRKDTALSVVALCTLAEVGCALLAFTLVAASASWIGAHVIRQPGAGSLLVLYALSMLVSAGEDVFGAILRVFGYFRWQAMTDVAAGTARLVLIAILLNAGSGIVGVLVAHVMTAIVTTAVRLIQAYVALARAFGAPLRFRLRDAGVPSRRILSLMVATSVTATLKGTSDSLGELFLGYFRGPAEVGVFRMGKILLRGLGLVGGSAYQVLYPKLADAIARGRLDIARDVRRLLGWILAAGVPAAVLLFALAPFLIRLLGGPGFERSASVLRIVVWGDLLFLLFVWAHPLAIALDRASVGNVAWLLACIVWIVGSTAAVPAGGYLASSALHLTSRAVVVLVYSVGLERALEKRGGRLWVALIPRGSSLDLWLQPLSLIKRRLAYLIAGFAGYLEGRVLDLGCGRKPYRDLIRGRVVGMDIDGRVRPEVVGNALSLPFRDACFDGVLCSELLEHVLDPELSIAEIARVTRPGGVLVLTAPMMWYLHREPNDFYRFTNYGLCHLLSRHGFRVVEMKSTGGIWLFLSTRLLEELHRMISVIVAPPFVLARWVVGWEPPGRGRLASLLLLPLNVALSGLVLGLDRLSRKDVLGWVVLARRSIVTDWAAGSTSGGGGSGTVNALRRCEGRAPGGAPNLSARRPK